MIAAVSDMKEVRTGAISVLFCRGSNDASIALSCSHDPHVVWL